MITIDGKTFEIGPDTAVFAPINAKQRVEVDGTDPLRYMIINAPPAKHE
jgi:mannose-6-phosphate isomerase-like protein (cupin superfamily)